MTETVDSSAVSAIAAPVPHPESGVTVASLYVGDLKPEVGEQVLWNVFNSYGQILSIKICRDSHTNASLGYGYVNFRSPSEADRAMKALNFTHIEDKPCRIMWSMRDPQRRKTGLANLFLKNIDVSVDSKALYDAFVVFGPILSCKLATDDNGRSKGYGFIQFYNEKDSAEALAKANGVEFLKKKIIVTRFMPKAQRAEQVGEKVVTYTNVFIKNFKQDWTHDQMKEAFSKFGPITSSVADVDESGVCLGYGFVNFELHEHALEAVKKMNGFKLPSGNILYVDRSQKRSERQQMLRRAFAEKKLEEYRRFQNLNLYIKNFDDNVTEEKLKSEFSQFGAIQSVHIMKDEHGKSKGFGFVCFTTAEDAARAIAEMNGKLLDTKPLYVAMAQPREERRKLFENRLMTPYRYQQGLPPPLFQFYPGAPAPQNYLPQFGNRFPSMQVPPSVRQGSRQMPQQVGGVPQMFQHPIRVPFMYAPGGNFHPAQYRQRVSGPHSLSGGAQQKPGVQSNGVPRHQYSSYGSHGGASLGYPNSVSAGVRPMQQLPAQMAVNYISTADQANTQQKVTLPNPHSSDVEDKEKFGRRIFEGAHRSFSQFDEQTLGKLTGMVMKVFEAESSTRTITDSEIDGALREAVRQFTNQDASSSTGAS